VKKTVVTIATLLVVASVVSCYPRQWIVGSGRLITEERSVTEFHSVELRGSGRLYVTQGEPQRLVVTTDDNIMPYLRTDVRHGVLVVYTKPGIHHPTDLDVNVTMARVRGLSLSGSGIIEGQNQIRSDSIDIAISGSGDASLAIMAKEASTRLSGSGRMSLDLDCGSLVSRISGSGRLYLTGESQTHEYHTSGSGKLRAYDLRTESTIARISGSGNCEINVSRHLDVRVSGSGSVRYRGSPRIESRISGSGSIRSVD